MPRNTYLMQTYFVISSLVLAMKVHSFITSLWCSLSKKYNTLLVSIALVPLGHWAVLLPLLGLVIYLSYVIYFSMDSSRNTYQVFGNGSQFLLVAPSSENASRDCVCIDKRLCYKGYYDDAYIECVSRSLPKVVNFNA